MAGEHSDVWLTCLISILACHHPEKALLAPKLAARIAHNPALRQRLHQRLARIKPFPVCNTLAVNISDHLEVAVIGSSQQIDISAMQGMLICSALWHTEQQ